MASPKPTQAPRVPKVRIARPAGRPFQLRYTDPDTGREVRISVGSCDEQRAQRLKQEVEAKLLLGQAAAPRTRSRGPHMSWEEFREEYSRLKASTLRDPNAPEFRLDVAERIMKPRRLSDLASDAKLAELQARLLAGDESQHVGQPRSAATVQSYMRAIIAALNWAHRPMKWLPDRIEFDVLTVDEDDLSKGRPITTEEFERMLDVLPKLVGEAAATSWRFLLRGLWESGMRLGEAMSTSWDLPGTITPSWTRGGDVLLRFPAKRQKSRKTIEVGMPPGFAALLAEVPEVQRTGYIFHPMMLRTMHTERRYTSKQVGRIISKIGQRAGVVVNEDGKFASAHDIRRGFGQRLANAGIPPRDLQAIMRHRSLTTTENYYLKDDAAGVAERLREYLGTSGISRGIRHRTPK